jgi:uncharacterized membrane protein YhaH (DUF805 family)
VLHLRRLLVRLSALGPFTLLLLAFIGFQIVVLPWAEAQINAGNTGALAGPLDLQFGITAGSAAAALEAYGQAGRQNYVWIELLIDGVYPILYAFLFGAALCGIYRRAFAEDAWLQWLPLVPFLGAAADYVENIGVVGLLLTYPPVSDPWLTIASVGGLVKWSMVLLSLLLLIVGAIGLVVKRLRALGEVAGTNRR